MLSVPHTKSSEVSYNYGGQHWLALSLPLHTPGSPSLRTVFSTGCRAAQKKCQGLDATRGHPQLMGYRSQWVSTPASQSPRGTILRRLGFLFFLVFSTCIKKGI